MKLNMSHCDTEVKQEVYGLGKNAERIECFDAEKK